MTEPNTDRDPAEGGDVGRPGADRAEGGSGADDGLVASEGVNETGAEDAPGASIGDPDQDGEADVEPNEPG